MAERQRSYSYYRKSVPMVFGDGWLVRIEKKAFGWIEIGKHSETKDYTTEETEDVPVYDSDSGQVIEGVTAKRKYTKHHSKVVKYCDFGRVSPYSYNVVFHAFEFLSKIFSFIRRIVMTIVDRIILFVLGLFIIAGLLNGFGEVLDSDAVESVEGLVLLYAGLVVAPSLLIAAVGFGLRSLFGIEKNLKISLEENGYNPEWRKWKKW